MKYELPLVLFQKYSTPFLGVKFSKHFFERLEERGLLYDFGKILKYIDDHLCELIFLAAESNRDTTKIKICGVKIPMILHHTDIPTLHIATIYPKQKEFNEHL